MLFTLFYATTIKDICEKVDTLKSTRYKITQKIQNGITILNCDYDNSEPQIFTDLCSKKEFDSKFQYRKCMFLAEYYGGVFILVEEFLERIFKILIKSVDHELVDDIIAINRTVFDGMNLQQSFKKVNDIWIDDKTQKLGIFPDEAIDQTTLTNEQKKLCKQKITTYFPSLYILNDIFDNISFSRSSILPAYNKEQFPGDNKEALYNKYICQNDLKLKNAEDYRKKTNDVEIADIVSYNKRTHVLSLYFLKRNKTLSEFWKINPQIELSIAYLNCVSDDADIEYNVKEFFKTCFADDTIFDDWYTHEVQIQVFIVILNDNQHNMELVKKDVRHRLPLQIICSKLQLCDIQYFIEVV